VDLKFIKTYKIY